MLAVKIALRNLIAHRHRNFVVFAVTAGVSFFLFLFLSFSDGEIENVKNGVSSFWAPWADIKAVPADSGALDNPIRQTPQLLASLRAVPEIREAIGRHWNLGMDLFAQDKRYLDFGLYSLDPGDATFHSRIEIVDGKDLGSNDRDAVLLHSQVKKTIPVHVGDTVTLIGKDFFGQMASRKLRVAGFYTPLLDNPNLYTSILIDPHGFTALAGYADDESNQVLIRLKPGADAHRVLDSLVEWGRTQQKNLRFYIPAEDEFETGNSTVFRMVRLILVVMVLITLFITAFGVMNVVSVNLFDRKKEIGTYFCLGCEKPFLLATYTLEIFAVNLAGSLAGVAAGLVGREIINALKWTTTEPGLQIVMGGSRFTLGLSPSTLFWILGGVSLVTLITALTTLGKALNVPPVVAVKETE